ncbi:MAG: hypothetical protein GX853_04545 [Chloroflexi bacterium]|jgi:hypothetical protein|nr:hypothetical protein [Chloroflexota bacterium]
MITRNLTRFSRIVAIFVIMISSTSHTNIVLANDVQHERISGFTRLNLSERTNCYVLLEPVKDNQIASNVLSIECNLSAAEIETKFHVSTTYLLAQFYDNVNYGNIIVHFGGPEQCSDTVSYQVSSLPSNLNNRMSSGSGFSGCYNIKVYDLINFGGDSYSCRNNCPSFESLNDRVSSWKISN